MKDFCNENFKSLEKEIEDGIRKWKGLPHSCTLMDWQNQYCENGFNTKNNAYVQSNPHQNSKTILH
jgi:hypothetical protein